MAAEVMVAEEPWFSEAPKIRIRHSLAQVEALLSPQRLASSGLSEH
jgi:hypothetical protein